MDFSHLIFFASEQAAEHAADVADTGVIGTLGLNWKLFLAQLVNFTIVLLILWKWVFKPVAGALQARQERIERSVTNASEIEQRVKEFEKKREEQMKQARIVAEGIINKAAEAATGLRAEIVERAKVEAEKITAEARAVVETEKKQMLTEVKAQIAGLTILASERILKEELDERKHSRLIEEALSSIK